MKNLINPQTLATFREQKSTPEIVKFLDNNREIKTIDLCKLIGIRPQVVYNYRANRNRKKSKDESGEIGIPSRSASKSYQRYTAEEKFTLVEEYLSGSKKEKAELLRKYGLYQSDMDRWLEKIREASLSALGKRKPRRDKKSDDQVRIEKLEKDLKVQEKTTAKLSTLLVLQKKTFDFLKGDG